MNNIVFLIFLITFICLFSKCPSKTITFIASKEAMGDGINPETMDKFNGTQYPWLSLIIPKLRSQGHQTEIVCWEEDTINWNAKPHLVMGPVWGYASKQKAFISWLNRIDHMGISLKNSSDFLLWNIRKTYLRDLYEAGISIPETQIIPSNSTLTLDAAIEKMKDKNVIIKGIVDSGAFGYRHLTLENYDDCLEHFEFLKKNHEGVVMQPFLQEVIEKGELSFVFFNETFSHAILKVPKKGEERVQCFYGGLSFPIIESNISQTIQKIKKEFRSDLKANASEIRSAYKQVMIVHKKLFELLKQKEIETPIYLRIDGVMVSGEFLVMEVEGIEPYMEMKEAIEFDQTNRVIDNYSENILK